MKGGKRKIHWSSLPAEGKKQLAETRFWLCILVILKTFVQLVGKVNPGTKRLKIFLLEGSFLIGKKTPKNLIASQNL